MPSREIERFFDEDFGCPAPKISEMDFLACAKNRNYHVGH
jgi:hypothetical protein